MLPFLQIDIIAAVMIVWRVNGIIIRSVLSGKKMRWHFSEQR